MTHFTDIAVFGAAVTAVYVAAAMAVAVVVVVGHELLAGNYRCLVLPVLPLGLLRSPFPLRIWLDATKCAPPR